MPHQPNAAPPQRAASGDGGRPFLIAGAPIRCSVLDNGMRIIARRDFFDALLIDSSVTPSQMIQHLNLRVNAPATAQILEQPIRFAHAPGGPSKTGYLDGYPATLLIDLCFEIDALRRRKNIPPAYEKTAERAKDIIQSASQVGVAALVDEITGYQNVRPPESLQKII